MNEPVESRRLIDLEAVSRSFGAIRAVDGVSFEVRAGEVHGLCGHNGAGKSTVVKMITGLVQPDGGRIMIDGEPSTVRSPQDAQRRGIALVDQELSVVPILTVADNILLGGKDEPFVRRPRAARARVRELLDLVGLTDVDPSDSTADLSMGGRQLVEIARALGRNAKLLVLDEPTATLSTNEIAHVFTAVRQVAASGCGVIYVSHRLDEVLDLCDRVTVLRDGKLVDTVTTESIDVDRLVSMMLGDVAPAPVPSLPDAGRGGGAAVRVRDLSVGARTAAFGLEAKHGHVYALAGQVGSGATEVLRAMAGLEPTAYGTVEIGGKKLRLGSPTAAVKAGVSYLSNDRKGDGLFLGLSARENLIATRLDKVSRGPFLNMDALKKAAAELIGIIGIGPERLPDPALNFSGGNQQKIFLGRTLETPETELLLLDEPTRGVDVKGRMEIHNLIRDAARDGTTVIFASTEIDEILDLADDIVTMRSGRIVGRHPRAEADTEMLLAEMTHGRPEGVTA